MKLRFACPQCGETDLFVSVAMSYRFDGEKGVVVQYADDHDPHENMTLDDLTVCSNDECEFCDLLRHFLVPRDGEE